MLKIGSAEVSENVMSVKVRIYSDVSVDLLPKELCWLHTKW